jgi:hypothetical protein
MKRRNFLKGLAAVALAPIAATTALAKTDTSPANVVVTPAFDLKDVHEPRWDVVSRAMDVMRKGLENLDESSHKARQDAEKLRESLKDLYISPEAYEDLRNWGVDQLDEETRKALFEVKEPDESHKCEFYAHTTLGHARLDNRDILLVDFDEGGSEPEDCDYRAVALKGPPVLDGWGYDEGPYVDYAQRRKDREAAVQEALDKGVLSGDILSEEIHELGRKGPYHRWVEFPVDCEWDDDAKKWVKKEEVDA